MKVTYLERVERKIALNRNKYCSCGEHEYEIVEQLEPNTEVKWSIRCPYCGRETPQTCSKTTAMHLWKYNYEY